MLFEIESLQSCYDFHQKIPDEKQSIKALALEIYHQTERILELKEQHQRVFCCVHDMKDQPLFIDDVNVSPATWNRSVLEIQEILYRKKKDGVFQKQFSLNKALTAFHVEEPENNDEYQYYLQLLYFFYMTCYFIYPKKNLFKFLSDDHYYYVRSFDEGSFQQEYMTFIMLNVLMDDNTQLSFYRQCHRLECLMYEISTIVEEYERESLMPVIDAIINRYTVCQHHASSVLLSLCDYCYHYTMYSYCLALHHQLEVYMNEGHYEDLKIFPYESWKHHYLSLDELDSFLMSRQLYAFCKQDSTKSEVRDRLKWKDSQAVIFLKALIDYDLHDNASKKLVVDFIDHEYKLYPLKIAVILKTYLYLVNDQKLKIKIDNHRFQSFRYALIEDYHQDKLFISSMALRLFLLIAMGEYKHCIDFDYDKDDFIDEYGNVEIINLKIFEKAYAMHSYEEVVDFFEYILSCL